MRQEIVTNGVINELSADLATVHGSLIWYVN